MSNQVTEALVKGYHSNFDLLLQERGSKLRPFVREEVQMVESDFWDRIGSTEMTKRTDRHGDTQYTNTPHDRRRVTMDPWDWADLIDKPDKIRMLGDPQSAYVQNAVMAAGRAIDTTIIDAAYGNAYSGKDGATAVAHDTANQRIAVDYDDEGGTGNTNLTVAKLRRARTLFRKNHVPEDEPLYIAASAECLQGLLRSTEVGSIDFNNVKALVEGEVKRYMGFTFVHIESLPADGSGYRRVLAWSQTGLLLAMGQETMARINEMPNKKYSVQVFVSVDMGASRMEEEKIVEILCDESA